MLGRKEFSVLFITFEKAIKLILRNKMKLIFRIQYRTLWGEEVRIIFDEDESQSIALSTRDGIEWQGSCEYQLSPCDAPLTYRYAIYQNNACTRKELGAIAHIIIREMPSRAVTS